MNYTPEHIDGPEELPPNSVFVFGSNTKGVHGTGSAATAFHKFGAVIGQAHGRQGMSYAICTTELGGPPYSLDMIGAHIAEFLDYADAHPSNIFCVTKIGTQRAGYSTQDIAALWQGEDIPPNVVLPREFVWES